VELALLLAFMIFTICVMGGMIYVFKEWLARRDRILNIDEHHGPVHHVSHH
jgi:hypothetical protein